MDIMERLSDLAYAASQAGLPACTEKQALYIESLLTRKGYGVEALKHETMLTKKGASNYISEIPLWNRAPA